MKKVMILSALALIAFGLTNCSISRNNVEEPIHYVEFQKDDFTYSDMKEGESTVYRILGIDWQHLFVRKSGETNKAGFTIVGFAGRMLQNSAVSYALYPILEANPDYDIVIYPQYTLQTKGVPFIYTKTECKVKTRLGKLKQ